ncbi:MAG: hypothetical protein ACPMAQ_08600 [Phycisphaerae bacterium]
MRSDERSILRRGTPFGSVLAHRVAHCLLFLLPCGCLAQNTSRPAVPVRLGVDDGGSYHEWVAKRHPWECPAWFQALDELGVRFVCTHFSPVTDAGRDNSAMTRRQLEAFDRAMRDHGLEYTLNVELSNWTPRLEITPGVDELEHPGGIHRWDLRMEWLSAVLPPARPAPPALLGVTYDECEHMLLSNNKYSDGKATYDKPFLVNTHGMPLTTAYDRLVAEAKRVREEHYAGRIRLQTEQVWPDLFHIFARAGWTIAPKLLKENIGPVVMSVALGAAIQYQDAGTSLWASPDLWNGGRYPGHSPEALRSALLMAYWLGAETIYVENLDFHGWKPRHPLAEAEGSLLAWSDADHYRFTAHGRVVREFYREYVPAHPRTIRWQDYDPRVAIIRLPDGGWGQYGAGPDHGEAPSRNRLLGNREMPLDEPASEWLYVWPILTHGAARPGAISSNNPFVYPKAIEEFFAPIDSVAVFDHTVEPKRLANVDCMILCGHALSHKTFEAVRDRVAAGATCIIARRLYARHAKPDLPGDWLIVDDFKDPRIAKKLVPFLGPPDVARFRFRHDIVEFRRGSEPDAVTVRVSDRK